MYSLGVVEVPCAAYLFHQSLNEWNKFPTILMRENVTKAMACNKALI